MQVGPVTCLRGAVFSTETRPLVAHREQQTMAGMSLSSRFVLRCSQVHQDEAPCQSQASSRKRAPTLASMHIPSHPTTQPGRFAAIANRNMHTPSHLHIYLHADTQTNTQPYHATTSDKPHHLVRGTAGDEDGLVLVLLKVPGLNLHKQKARTISRDMPQVTKP